MQHNINLTAIDAKSAALGVYVAKRCIPLTDRMQCLHNLPTQTCVDEDTHRFLDIVADMPRQLLLVSGQVCKVHEILVASVTACCVYVQLSGHLQSNRSVICTSNADLSCALTDNFVCLECKAPWHAQSAEQGSCS